MMDFYDRASAREEEWLGDALRDQQRRAGLFGKTVADSAHDCEDCDCPIPEKRRLAVPGVQACIDCQNIRDRENKQKGKR